MIRCSPRLEFSSGQESSQMNWIGFCSSWAVCGVFALACGCASGQNDRIRDVETGWGYVYGATSAQTLSYISNGSRPFGITRIGSNAYDLAMVSNTGSYAVTGSTAYFNQTTASLSSLLSSNNMRLLDVEPYDNAGTTNYAAIVVPNSGATAAPGWGWLAGVTFTDVVNWLNANPTLRLIDLDHYAVGGQQRYTAVAVPNTGANFQAGWWYATGATESQVLSALTANGARLIDIDVVSVGTIVNPQVLYSYIMVSDNPGAGVFVGSVSELELAALMERYGTRLTVFQRYTNAFGQNRYAVAGVDNANAHTRRIRDMINSGTDGQTGFMLKQVGGPELAGVNRTFVWEPASTIKLLHAVYAIWRCANLQDSLANNVEYRNIVNGNIDSVCNGCAFNWTCTPAHFSLGHTIEQMLEPSNNQALIALERRYTVDALEDFAVVNGFGGITIPRQVCECGVLNTGTCVDFVTMMEKVADGSLFSQSWQDELYIRMNDLDEQGFGIYPVLNNVINEEAALTNLTSLEISSFKASMGYANKGGSYNCSQGQYYRTDAGWASVPFKIPFLTFWIVAPREYSFAVFAHAASNPNNANIVFTARDEMFREVIRAALASWDSACSPPTIFSPPASQSRTAGQDATFSVLVLGGGDGNAYRWQRWTPGGGFVDLLEVPGQISGTATNTLTLFNVDAADAADYRVVFSSVCGTILSPAATLTVTTCRADTNGDGVLSPADFTAWIAAFNTMGPACDQNGDGQCTPADFTAWIANYNAGC